MAVATHASLWRKIIMVVLVAWLAASLVLDLIVMPSLYSSGMMDSAGFVIAGDMIFSAFNRVELLAGSAVLTGCMIWSAISNAQPLQKQSFLLAIAAVLLVIPLIYTYSLTPNMSALGVQLNLFDPATVPDQMDQLHKLYWGLELCKLAAVGLLLSRLGKQPQPSLVR
ncbi:MAG: hypothetical protein ACFCU8_00320 [Thermosynechococcaceae cyanobacterium]